MPDLPPASLGLLAGGRWLALPICLLLFVQWPLRDVVHAHSRVANDLAQWLFALYVSVALSAATRANAHLAADALARRYSPELRRGIARVAALLVLLPWAVFVLVAGTPLVWQSVRQMEAFPDTGNPGYFLIKLSVWLLAFLVGAEALRSAARR